MTAKAIRLDGDLDAALDAIKTDDTDQSCYLLEEVLDGIDALPPHDPAAAYTKVRATLIQANIAFGDEGIDFAGALDTLRMLQPYQ